MNVLLTNSRSMRIPGVQKVRLAVGSVILLENGLKCLIGLRKTHVINCDRIYIAHDNPYLLCLIVIYTSFFKRMKITLFFPELYDGYKWLFPILKGTLILVDQIVVPSYNRKVAIKIFYGYKGDFVISPNKRDSVSSFQITSSFSRSGYVYTGVLYPERDILEGIKTVKDMIDIFGAGNDDYIKKISLNQNINYKGPFEQQDEFDIVKKYKVGILYYPMNSLNNTLCSPNKFFTYRDLGLTVHCESPNAFKALNIYNIITNSNIHENN